MKRLTTITFILCAIFSFAQEEPLQEIYNRDKIKIDSFVLWYHSISPNDYQEDLIILQEILRKLKVSIKSNSNRPQTLKRLNRELKLFQSLEGKLVDLNKLWEKSSQQIEALQDIEDKIDLRLLEGKLKQVKQYKVQTRELGLNEALKSFRKSMRDIKRKERGLFVKVIYFYMTEVTTKWKNRAAFYDFTDYLREAMVSIYALEKKRVEDQLQVLKDSLELTIDFQKELHKKNLSLYKDLQRNKQVKSDIESWCSDQQESVDSLTAQIKYKEKNLSKLQSSMDSLEVEVSGLRESKGKLVRNTINLEQEITHLEKLERQRINKLRLLGIRNNTLEQNNIEIEERNSKLEKKSFKTNTLLGVSVIFLVVGLGILLANRNQIMRARQNLASTNQRLQEAQILLHRRTTELELSYKELNHRVKNNLQQVSSLIYLQAGEIEDEKTKELFQSLQGRIDTIKIIHQKLHTSGSHPETNIDLAEYVGDLTNYIVDRVARVQLDLQAIRMEMDHALYIGLIVNELATNSKKYAFDFPSEPLISIKIFEVDGFLSIDVKDNGPGFKKDFSMDSLRTFGLKSVEMIVKSKSQRGTLEILKGPGAHLRMRIPFDKNTRRLIS